MDSITIYQVKGEKRYRSTDMDGCPCFEYESTPEQLFPSLESAKAWADNYFDTSSAFNLWVAVYAIEVTEQGSKVIRNANGKGILHSRYRNDWNEQEDY